MDTAADKLTETLLLGEHLTVFGVFIYLFKHGTLGVWCEFVIEEKVETGDKILTVLISFHRKMNL